MDKRRQGGQSERMTRPPSWLLYLKIFGLIIVLIVAVVAKYYYMSEVGKDVRELFAKPSNDSTTLRQYD